MYAKRPFGGPQQVIEYLGRYTHKVAISNHRIQSVDKQGVTFEYKDYKTGGEKKTMTLDAQEFVRRFVQHILPPKLRRIRHYGFLSHRAQSKALDNARRALQVKAQQKRNKNAIKLNGAKPPFNASLAKTPTDAPVVKQGRCNALASYPQPLL